MSDKQPIDELKQKDNESMRNLLRTKYRIELCVLIAILITILVLSCNGLIDNCTVGTLMGTIIGYSLKDLRKYQN
jgi:hypothetical protein